MKHLGDITKINGFDVPPVNVVIGGSPCQDLSIAGKRAGLAGERSGLFMEQLRVIKEMREADANRGRKGESIRPRFMVWENVPGAFSSNNGADFGAVLQETVRVVCKEAPVVPMPKNGWPKAGCLYGVDGNGGGWSVAWRVFDAQFWGVPQRRSRIALVADFGGRGAPEILFERKSVSGHFEQSEQTREEITGAVRTGTFEHDRVLENTLEPIVLESNQDHATISNNGICTTLPASMGMGGGYVPMITEPYSFFPQMRAENQCFKKDISGTLVNGTNPGFQNGVCQPVIFSFDSLASNSMKSSNPNSGCRRVELSRTLDASCPDPAKNQGGIAICQAVSFDYRNGVVNSVAETLQARTGHTLNAGGVIGQPVFCLQGNGIDRADTAGCNGAGWKEGKSYTLNTIDRPAVAFEEKVVFDARGNGEGNISPTITGDHENRVTDYTAVCVEKLIRWIVRRLTPLECERLQGFPDGWTDIGDWTDSKGKKHTAADTPRYKALGNSIALPSWFYVLQKLSLFCGSECTMASLFDGIGGFPLIWESLNGKGSCLWASEIEEFPIAVTSLRFAVDT